MKREYLEYFGVKLDIVWDTVKHEIPPLYKKLAKIITQVKK